VTIEAGWYDNSQPALRLVFIVAQCITRVCKLSVCMGGAQQHHCNCGGDTQITKYAL